MGASLCQETGIQFEEVNDWHKMAEEPDSVHHRKTIVELLWWVYQRAQTVAQDLNYYVYSMVAQDDQQAGMDIEAESMANVIGQPVVVAEIENTVLHIMDDSGIRAASTGFQFGEAGIGTL
jgi:hypothetical protein